MAEWICPICNSASINSGIEPLPEKLECPQNCQGLNILAGTSSVDASPSLLQRIAAFFS